MKKSLIGFVALVLIITSVFAFTTASHRFTIVYYQYSGVQPPTASSIVNVSNWALLSSPPTYTTGTELYFIEFDNATTTLAEALEILSVNLPPTDNQTYSQAINGVLASVKVHLRR